MFDKLKNVRIPVKVRTIVIMLALLAMSAMSAMPALAKWCYFGDAC